MFETGALIARGDMLRSAARSRRALGSRLNPPLTQTAARISIMAECWERSPAQAGVKKQRVVEGHQAHVPQLIEPDAPRPEEGERCLGEDGEAQRERQFGRQDVERRWQYVASHDPESRRTARARRLDVIARSSLQHQTTHDAGIGQPEQPSINASVQRLAPTSEMMAQNGKKFRQRQQQIDQRQQRRLGPAKKASDQPDRPTEQRRDDDDDPAINSDVRAPKRSRLS